MAVGIRDWDKKLAAIGIIYEVGVYTDIADSALAKFPEYDEEEISRLRYNIKSWFKTQPNFGPKGKGWFLNILANELGCPEHVTGITLVRCSFEDFLSYLPKEDREKIEKRWAHEYAEKSYDQVSEQKLAAAEVSSIEHSDFHPLLVSKSLPTETIKHGLRRGRIDQKLMYQNPESAETWEGVVNCADYPMYDHCRDALGRLTETDGWQNAFGSNGPKSVVMLGGGGAGSKDTLLLSKLLKKYDYSNESPLSYIIVDSSPYMIVRSLQFIHSKESILNLQGNHAIQTVVYDIMKLSGDTPLRYCGKPAAWFLTGGTIGNLNEQEFFQSVADIAEKDDLLVVGIDSIKPGDEDELSQELDIIYNNDALRWLITSPLRAVLTEINSEESMKSALSRVNVQAVEGYSNGYSLVPGSMSAVFSIDIDEREIVLLTSTRYNKESFIDFAAKFGWEYVDESASSMRDTFQHLAFKLRS